MHIGYNIPDLTDGIWMVRTESHSKSMTSLVWKIGNIPKADLNLYASLQKYGDDLSRFILELNDVTSDAYKFYSETSMGWDENSIGFYGISSSELITAILRKLAMLIQEDNENDKK